MNTPPNDGNESVIDIFVLSTSSSLPSLIRDQLEIQGYNVTFFSDGTDLITTLRSGKPNLLMCDTSSADAEGYDVCRQIKTDDYLWNIPVLILTGASDLGDLLNVLDSNADNFIAQPYDPAYLLSLIEGMLTTPVQRQTPDQIKTQFKIQHDDQIFVVTADRRKLLEFLLSSFEIAVNKSSDLSQAQDTIQSLDLTVKKLEHSLEENSRSLGILSETLKAKELKIAEMSGTLSDREQEISEKTDKIAQLSQDLNTEKSHHSEADQEIQRMVQERDQTASEHRAAYDELQKNVSMVSAELDIVQKNLETTKNTLLAQTARCTELENELNSTSVQNEQVEKEYRALLLEAEQLKVSLASEKNRATAAEQETNAVLLAKTQAEQDLTQIITDLNSTAKQQAIDITRLKDELESAQTRFTLQEEKLRALFEEKEQTESALRSQIAAHQDTLDNLQGKHVATAAVLEERNAAVKTLTDNLAAASAELMDTVSRKDKAETLVQSLTRSLEERDANLKSLTDNLASANRDLTDVAAQKERAASLVQSLTRTLEERDANLKSLTDNLASANRDLTDVAAQKEQAESLVQSLTRSLEETRSAREKEQRQFRETEESLNAAILERERALEDLRGAHDEVTTSLMSNRDDLTRTKQDLESFITQKATLEGNLGATLARIRELESELHAASSGKLQIHQQVQSITDELEHVKAELEAERHYHHDADEKLKSAAVAGQHLEQELQHLVHERKVAQSELVAEQQLRQTAEEQARALELERDNLRNALKSTDAERRLQDDGRSAKIQKLKEDFETVLGLQRTLEEQVTTLTRDKLQAEQRAANLSAEIDQARAALADEWEDHMTDQERLAAVVEEKQHLEKALHPREEPAPKHDERDARYGKSPDMPGAVNAGTRESAMAESVPSKEPEIPKPYVLSVDDLFEDDETARAITAPSTGDTGSRETRPDTTPDSSEDTTLSFENEDPEEDQRSEDVTHGSEKPDDYVEEHGSTSDVSGDATPTGPDIGFNRAQWLDLLKWAHHCEVLTHEQRMQIVRMGRLIQKGRNLTKKQEEQVMEIIVLVKRLGYRL